MYNNYRIVVLTAAGRRRYMQLLVPFIVSSEIVDRYEIWVNTNNSADIEFFKQLANQFPVVELVWQPEGIVNGNASINSFYKRCTDTETVYFKIDDDIIWMEPRLIERMVKFRIDNPQYFLVSPLVINNSLCTYLLQIENRIRLDTYYNASASNPILWRNDVFATDLHTWFLNNYLKRKKWEDLHVGPKIMAMTRFSINAVLWFGKDFNEMNGEVIGDDEEYLSCIYPTIIGKANAWNGDVVASHYAFYPQRSSLDKTHILEQYCDECHAQWASDNKMKAIDEAVQSIMTTVNRNEEYYMSLPLTYEKNNNQQSFKLKLLKFLPYPIVRFLVRAKHLGKAPESHILDLE